MVGAALLYALIGLGFTIAAEEGDPDWKWWELFLVFLLWPTFVAYTIGKLKVNV